MRTSLSVSTVKRAFPATTQASGFATGSISSAPDGSAKAAAASMAASIFRNFIFYRLYSITRVPRGGTTVASETTAGSPVITFTPSPRPPVNSA